MMARAASSLLLLLLFALLGASSVRAQSYACSVSAPRLYQIGCSPSGAFICAGGSNATNACAPCATGYTSAQGDPYCSPIRPACTSAYVSAHNATTQKCTTSGGYVCFAFYDASNACALCPPGLTSIIGMPSCSIPCTANTYANAATIGCVACAAGTVSSQGATSCTNCPAGYTSSGAGALRGGGCTACPAFFTSAPGAPACTHVPPASPPGLNWTFAGQVVFYDVVVPVPPVMLGFNATWINCTQACTTSVVTPINATLASLTLRVPPLIAIATGALGVVCFCAPLVSATAVHLAPGPMYCDPATQNQPCGVFGGSFDASTYVLLAYTGTPSPSSTSVVIPPSLPSPPPSSTGTSSTAPNATVNGTIAWPLGSSNATGPDYDTDGGTLIPTQGVASSTSSPSRASEAIYWSFVALVIFLCLVLVTSCVYRTCYRHHVARVVAPPAPPPPPAAKQYPDLIIVEYSGDMF